MCAVWSFSYPYLYAAHNLKLIPISSSVCTLFLQMTRCFSFAWLLCNTKGSESCGVLCSCIQQIALGHNLNRSSSNRLSISFEVITQSQIIRRQIFWSIDFIESSNHLWIMMNIRLVELWSYRQFSWGMQSTVVINLFFSAAQQFSTYTYRSIHSHTEVNIQALITLPTNYGK